MGTRTKLDVCRLLIEQDIEAFVAAGREDPAPAGRETAKWLEEKALAKIDPRTLEKAFRRAMAAAKRKLNPEPGTSVPKLTKEQKDYINRATNQAKHDVAVHQNNSGEMLPLPDFDPAMDRARSAISYLKEIQADDPKRLEALQTIVDYLKTQGFELVKPPTSKE